MSWQVDGQGPALCGDIGQMIYQFSCEWIGDELVAELSVDDVWTETGLRSIPGVLVIPRNVFDRLPRDRERRSDRVHAQLRKYFCRRRPRSEFVYLTSRP